MQNEPQTGSVPPIAQPPTMPPTMPPTVPATMPPTMPPTYAPYPPYTPYPPYPPYAQSGFTPLAPPPPPGQSGAGRIARTAAVVLALLIVISVAAASLPGSVARARAVAYPKPAVAITMPQSNGPVVVGTSAEFVAQVRAGNDLSFTWDFGDNSSAVGASVNHTYSDYGNGAYTVTLTAVDPIGQESSSQLTVNVRPAPPHAAFAPTQDPNYPFDVQFDGSSSTGTQLSCFWDFGDGNTDNSGECQTEHQYQNLGNYNVTLTVQDIANQTDSTSQSVTVSLPKPTASFTAQVDQFSALCVNVDASNSTGYQLSYSWDFGEGYGSSSGSVTDYYCYSNAGTYTIKLTVSDAGGQTDSQTQQVTVG
ncbi:MAG TPA: PKD domain-containing protein [Ktedonobacterales bacterium]|nr:PKD domain-containing protein [Ktedonobacterales bacterium]